MIESVAIPIYCESEKDKSGALMTLKTVRVGFPTKDIFVYWYGGVESVWSEAHEIAPKGVTFLRGRAGMRNDLLIKQLAETQIKGFAVIDSDMVFYENCEDYECNGLIGGEYIPEFVCPISKAITASRLHTAFFVVPDPVNLRRAIDLAYRPAIPKFCPFDPFAPVVTFKDQVPYFHDSCSVLYHAVGGEKFEPDMLKRFEHLYGGSYMAGTLHADRIKAAYDDPEKARGTRDMMAKYFDERKP